MTSNPLEHGNVMVPSDHLTPILVPVQPDIWQRYFPPVVLPLYIRSLETTADPLFTIV